MTQRFFFLTGPDQGLKQGRLSSLHCSLSRTVELAQKQKKGKEENGRGKLTCGGSRRRSLVAVAVALRLQTVELLGRWLFFLSLCFPSAFFLFWVSFFCSCCSPSMLLFPFLSSLCPSPFFFLYWFSLFFCRSSSVFLSPFCNLSLPLSVFFC